MYFFESSPDSINTEVREEVRMEDRKSEPVEEERRRFLSLIPLGVAAAIIATIGVPSKLFLDPPPDKKSPENWKDLGDVADLTGEEPIARTVTLESQTGWSKTIEDQTVFVLPKHDKKVLSSVCPHEGCPIVWEKESGKFLCPCHDSFFSDDGKRLSGPAKNDLTAIKSRILEGKLQIDL